MFLLLVFFSHSLPYELLDGIVDGEKCAAITAGSWFYFGAGFVVLPFLVVLCALIIGASCARASFSLTVVSRLFFVASLSARINADLQRQTVLTVQ